MYKKLLLILLAPLHLYTMDHTLVEKKSEKKVTYRTEQIPTQGEFGTEFFLINTRDEKDLSVIQQISYRTYSKFHRFDGRGVYLTQAAEAEWSIQSNKGTIKSVKIEKDKQYCLPLIMTLLCEELKVFGCKTVHMKVQNEKVQEYLKMGFEEKGKQRVKKKKSEQTYCSINQSQPKEMILLVKDL